MKRRIPALLLILALVACAAIGLAACNEGGKDGGKEVRTEAKRVTRSSQRTRPWRR